MGQARDSNPNSPQYRGQMPDHIVGGTVRTRIGVDAAWLEANPPTDIGPPVTVPDDKQMIQWNLIGVLVKPSAILPRDQWATTQMDLGVVHQMSMAEFKELAAERKDEASS